MPARVELLNFHEADVARLMEVWEDSASATHHFLTEQDIISLRPYVREGLEAMDTILCIRDETDVIQAFECIRGKKIEMLFVSPEFRGSGFGKLLIIYAINETGAVYVDVSEQNTQAIGFYEHMGFYVFDRSDFDEQGNSFPMLHMIHAALNSGPE